MMPAALIVALLALMLMTKPRPPIFVDYIPADEPLESFP
jgi:hypothetical protein